VVAVDASHDGGNVIRVGGSTTGLSGSTTGHRRVGAFAVVGVHGGVWALARGDDEEEGDANDDLGGLSRAQSDLYSIRTFRGRIGANFPDFGRFLTVFSRSCAGKAHV
jgi:hypothetical protein